MKNKGNNLFLLCTMIKIAIFWQHLASEGMITWTISGAKARLQIDEVNIKLNIMHFPLLLKPDKFGGGVSSSLHCTGTSCSIFFHIAAAQIW